MIIVYAKFYIKEDKKSQVLKEIEGLISASKKDVGCLEYSLYESTDNQLEFVMIENWESQEAIEKHNTNPLLLAFAKNLSTYSSKQPVLQIAETK